MRGCHGRSICSIARARRRQGIRRLASIGEPLRSRLLSNRANGTVRRHLTSERSGRGPVALPNDSPQPRASRGVFGVENAILRLGGSRGDAPRPVDTISLDMGSIRALRPLKLQGLEPAAMS
jgi:hypothetical protein